VPPWPALANLPSTTSAMDRSSNTVLLPSGSNYGFADERLLLGPAQLSDTHISSANLVSNAGDFTVNIDLTPAGAREWDALAEEQFHAYVALDFDGRLISVPLSEPSQSAFSSFGGKVQISGGFSKTTAESLVVDLESGPLPVALRVVSGQNGPTSYAG
jgi:preprotein translocase subunit SecD